MTGKRAVWIWIACGIAPWLVLVAVNAPGPTLDRNAATSLPDRCSWACHNRGCEHVALIPLLPRALTSDEGLFGETIEAMKATGSYVSVNLVLFCVLWPGIMWSLLGFALWQRVRIHELRTWREAAFAESSTRGALQ
jgi:hypothetical protein